VLSGGAAYDEIYLVALAGRAAQATCPIDNGGIGTISRNLFGHVRLGPVPAALLHHTISRTWAASAWPNVIGMGSPSLRLRRIIR